MILVRGAICGICVMAALPAGAQNSRQTEIRRPVFACARILRVGDVRHQQDRSRDLPRHRDAAAQGPGTED